MADNLDCGSNGTFSEDDQTRLIRAIKSCDETRARTDQIGVLDALLSAWRSGRRNAWQQVATEYQIHKAVNHNPNLKISAKDRSSYSESGKKLLQNVPSLLEAFYSAEGGKTSLWIVELRGQKTPGGRTFLDLSITRRDPAKPITEDPRPPDETGGLEEVTSTLPLSNPVDVFQRAPWQLRRIGQNVKRVIQIVIPAGMVIFAFSRGFHPNSNTRQDYLLRGFKYGLLWGVLGLLLLIVVAAFADRLRNRHARQRRANKVRIIVSRFKKAELGMETRQRVVHAIREHLGFHRVTIEEKEFEISPIEAEPGMPELARARSLLRKHGADLLIAGELKAWQQMKPTVDLRFIRDSDDPSNFLNLGFGDRYELDADFGPELGAALAAMAGAFGSFAVSGESGYFERSLTPLAEKLAPFAKLPPKVMTSQDKATLNFSYGLVQSVLGLHSGKPEALEEAAEAFQDAANYWGELADPIKWARSQNHRGVVLTTLGAWGLSHQAHEEAIRSLRKAIQKLPPETDPSIRAEARRNLGIALREAGSASGKPECFKEAEAAFEDALAALKNKADVMSRSAVLSGAAWLYLTMEESRGAPEETPVPDRTTRLDNTQRLFEAALESLPSYQAPVAWLDAAEGMSRTLYLRASFEQSAAVLRQAEKICESLIEGSGLDRFPVLWTRAQSVNGLILGDLSERKGNKKKADLAVDTMRRASDGDLQKRVPLQFAQLQVSLGHVLSRIALSRRSTELAKEAIERLNKAKIRCAPDFYPFLWARAEYERATALIVLSGLDSDPRHLDGAISALRSVNKLAMDRGLDGYAFCSAFDLGKALVEFGTRSDRIDCLNEACAVLRTVVTECIDRSWVRRRASAEFHLGTTLFELGNRHGSTSMYEEAERILRSAMDLIASDATADRQMTEAKLIAVMSQLAVHRQRTAAD